MRKYKNLRELREACCISQDDLGSYRVEKGHWLPGVQLLRRLTDQLNAAGAKVTPIEVMDLCRAHFPPGFDETESAMHETMPEKKP